MFASMEVLFYGFSNLSKESIASNKQWSYDLVFLNSLFTNDRIKVKSQALGYDLFWSSFSYQRYEMGEKPGIRAGVIIVSGAALLTRDMRKVKSQA